MRRADKPDPEKKPVSLINVSRDSDFVDGFSKKTTEDPAGEYQSSIDETLKSYCATSGITLRNCRPDVVRN